MSDGAKLEWEDLGGGQFRAKVPGGWVLKIMEEVFQEERSAWGWDWRPALCFIPDPGHQWGKAVADGSVQAAQLDALRAEMVRDEEPEV